MPPAAGALLAVVLGAALAVEAAAQAPARAWPLRNCHAPPGLSQQAVRDGYGRGRGGVGRTGPRLCSDHARAAPDGPLRERVGSVWIGADALQDAMWDVDASSGRRTRRGAAGWMTDLDERDLTPALRRRPRTAPRLCA